MLSSLPNERYVVVLHVEITIERNLDAKRRAATKDRARAFGRLDHCVQISTMRFGVELRTLVAFANCDQSYLDVLIDPHDRQRCRRVRK